MKALSAFLALSVIAAATSIVGCAAPAEEDSPVATGLKHPLK